MAMPQREAQATDTWLTPRKIIDPLGEFDLDTLEKSGLNGKVVRF